MNIIPCKSCGAPMVYLVTANGRKMPVDADSVDPTDEVYTPRKHVSHFSTCSEPGRHRKDRPRVQ